jgi:hypothetical protein
MRSSLIMLNERSLRIFRWSCNFGLTGELGGLEQGRSYSLDLETHGNSILYIVFITHFYQNWNTDTLFTYRRNRHID